MPNTQYVSRRRRAPTWVFTSPDVAHPIGALEECVGAIQHLWVTARQIQSADVVCPQPHRGFPRVTLGQAYAVGLAALQGLIPAVRRAMRLEREVEQVLLMVRATELRRRQALAQNDVERADEFELQLRRWQHVYMALTRIYADRPVIDSSTLALARREVNAHERLGKRRARR